MKEFIYEKEFSLPNDLCDKIIDFYENNNDIDLKSLQISFSEKNDNINDLKEQIIKELYENIFNYNHFLKNTNCGFDFNKLSIEFFKIQKYNINKDKSIYNNDLHYNLCNNKKNILNFILYLNDVDEGGETEFFGNYKIKPKKGKLLIFPSEWFFPHTEKIPLSNDKYIIYGWIYSDIN